MKSLSSSSRGSVRLWCLVQQLRLGVLFNESLTGTSPLGDVEPTTVELHTMQNCGHDLEPLQMMLRIAVAAKKKERSELRGELKKRQSKHEKEHAGDSQKLIDLIQGSGTVHV